MLMPVICRKARAGGEAFGRIRAAVVGSASATPVLLRFVMSLHLISLFTNHPAKLINLLALLLAFPGAWLLHATRRREQRALATLEAQSQSRRIDEPTLMLDGATLRMNRFFYGFGFACLGLALLVSWISTRV
jgi:hypothetical protein